MAPPVPLVEAAKELIPGELYWRPRLTRAAEKGVGSSDEDRTVLRLSDFSDEENFRGGVYSVPHYPPEAVGVAWGPLALDQTMAFCRILTRRASKGGAAVLATDTGAVSERANLAVLVGAYLIAMHGWSAERLAKTLVEERGIVFPCSWTKRPPAGATASGTMTVLACWQGLAIARDFGWFSGEPLRDDFATRFLCTQYRRQAVEYDMVWLAPQAVLVAADPMTVIQDPNPSTCDRLAPPLEFHSPSRGADIDRFAAPSTPVKAYAEQQDDAIVDAKEELDGNAETESTQALGLVLAVDNVMLALDAGCGGCTSAQGEQVCTEQRGGEKAEDLGPGTASPKRLPARRPSVASAMSSVLNASMHGNLADDDDRTAHTVCKDYGSMVDPSASRKLVPCEDFITLCLNNNVGQITRVNFSTELKAIGGSYQPELVKDHGILHQDVPVRDFDGGVPAKRDMREMLSTSRRLEDGKALLVHCKGGFGRSVLMACVHLVDRFDVPGQALLGWARIARPGAITTVEQELFLSKIRGSDDLAKRLGSGVCRFRFW